MKNSLFTLVIGVLLTSCNSDSTREKEPTTKKEVEEIIEEPVIIPNWSYNSTFDQMEGDSTFFAQTTSENYAYFSFPYDGGSTLTLTIRERRNDSDVYIRISKGQFNSTYSSGSVNVKIDDAKKQKYIVSGSSSGSPDILFLENENRFINSLKDASKLLIEAEFYSHGSEVFEFDVSDLNWNH